MHLQDGSLTGIWIQKNTAANLQPDSWCHAVLPGQQRLQ